MPIELETSEKMSRKYRIRKQKIDYILKKYKTMEQFIKLFREGALDEEDKEKLGENLNTCIDINTGVNEGYSRLLKQIMPNQAENKLLIYDSEWMTFFIDRLPKEEADVIKMSFGNYNNRNYYNLEIGKHFGISLERVRRMKES